MKLALALLLWPFAAMAEGDYLGPLIDGLSDADRSVEQIVSTLQASGLSVTMKEYYGPEILTQAAADPLYFYLSAEVTLPPEAATGLPPVIMVTCSRNGVAALKSPESGTLRPAVQLWPTVDFAPGAVAQLWCRAALLPLDGVALPSVEAVNLVLAERFDTVTRETGTAESSEGTGVGWVLYPPLSDADTGAAMPKGQTLFTATNPDPLAPHRPSWAVYTHWQSRFMHSFIVVSHLPPSGS